MTPPTCIAEGAQWLDVRARVDELTELFAVPESDPFADQRRTTAVVDDIVAYLRAHPLRKRTALNLTLEVPPHLDEPDLEPRVTAALARYSASQVAATERLQKINRFEGLARFPWGIMVALVAVLVVIGVHAVLPEDVQPVMEIAAPFVTVLIWVAIWSPIESLLYEGWTLARLRRAYALIGSTRVRIAVSEPAPAAGVGAIS